MPTLCSPSLAELSRSSFLLSCTIKTSRWNWTLVLPYLFVAKKRIDLFLVIITDSTGVILFFVPTLERIYQWLGTVDVDVNYEGQTATLVVKGHGASLFGRNWLTHFCVNWSSIRSIHCNTHLDKLIQQHSTLFRDELGSLKGTTPKILISSDAHKSRRVPYSLKEKVEQQLLRLQEEGVITPVRFSHWAVPIVPG